MNITSDLSDSAVLQAVGERISHHRIHAGITQAELAEEAGIGKRTLERVEAGRGAELVTIIRILRALDLIEGLDRLIPEMPPSPIEQLELRGKRRQRASRPRGQRADRAAPKKPWSWDET